jgi:hypothetical protein
MLMRKNIRQKGLAQSVVRIAPRESRPMKARRQKLLLPGALLVTIGAELLAPLVLVDFGLTTFFQ